jgi:hypothetical protein
LQSISGGKRVFLELLKYSRVKPLYEEGEKSCISNYRPISLLTEFSKIFEKVIYKRASGFINLTTSLQVKNLDLGKISQPRKPCSVL